MSLTWGKDEDYDGRGPLWLRALAWLAAFGIGMGIWATLIWGAVEGWRHIR